MCEFLRFTTPHPEDLFSVANPCIIADYMNSNSKGTKVISGGSRLSIQGGSMTLKSPLL